MARGGSEILGDRKVQDLKARHRRQQCRREECPTAPPTTEAPGAVATLRRLMCQTVTHFCSLALTMTSPIPTATAATLPGRAMIIEIIIVATPL